MLEPEPYERAALWKARAGAHVAQNDVDKATADLQQAVALDAMPEAAQLEAEYNLAQGYFMQENFNESADVFGKWAAHAKEITPEQAYRRRQRVRAGAALRRSAALRAEGRRQHAEPKEPWLSCCSRCSSSSITTPKSRPCSSAWCKAFRKAEYWLQLGADVPGARRHAESGRDARDRDAPRAR